ncbi:MAG: hypothetical protein COT73_04590 [Bdellovibrio sp. CG10_big_fil_rev_8_21_14_0_10_47_8]|nr:MAG: hypothetical protein COT73_04590 [Bdellovibrio sp. CG10_big_fil_rev_8_21_14_0_10_47_8]
MWALRVLNGPQAGQVYVLKKGRNRIGRGDNCDFQLTSSGISKEHLEIQVFSDQVLMTDLRSSNGTFVNGVKIQSAVMRIGDKISIDKVLFDVVVTQGSQGQPLVPLSKNPTPAFAAQPGGPLFDAEEGADHPSTMSPADQGPFQKASHYFHRVFMPALQQLVEVFEFRSVIIGFCVIFVFMVTLLTVFPMNQMTSESIQKESRRRALTVARALANANERAVRSGELSSYSADLVLKDEGIDQVMIVGRDGAVMAPPEMAGMTPKGDIAGFFQSVKGQTVEVSGEAGVGKIGAACPILIYDPEEQRNVAKAYAIVVYSTDSFRFDDGRALSLFIQMLAISMILGAGLFFLMYKLMEYPFVKANQLLDQALRENQDQIESPIRLRPLQQLLVTINSLLTRVQSNSMTGVDAGGGGLRDQELMNLIQLVAYPALLISKEGQVVVSVNHAFESLPGGVGQGVQGMDLSGMVDTALRQNIQELTEKATNNTFEVQSDQIEIAGYLFRTQCQAVTSGGEAKYFMVTLSPPPDEDQNGRGAA